MIAGGALAKPVAPAPASTEVRPKVGLVDWFANLPTFFREVRVEARKITWTSWKETWITSVMVGIMVVTTAIFFLVVDWGLGLLVQQILKLAV